MHTYSIIIAFIEYFFLLYLGIASLYILVFAIAGRFRKSRSSKIGLGAYKMAVLIPGYKEDGVIIEVAKLALQQQYPKNRFDVIVIADSFHESTMNTLNDLPVILIPVSFEKSTKAKALNKAMKDIGNHYDIAVVLDADNIMEPRFLYKINKAFKSGFKVVQGQRTAKNLNSTFAILDAVSEAINNHIFRSGHRALGLSSGLIGSGMAFDYTLFKRLMANIKAVGGFDKELEFNLFMEGYKIEYLKQAKILDEKIQSAREFNMQRRRWLSTNQVYFKKYFITGIKELFLRGNLDFFNKLYQMVLPPRVLLLGAVFLITMCYFIVDFFLPTIIPYIPAMIWYAVLGITILALIISVPQSFYNGQTLRALFDIPRAFLIMFLLLFRLKGANKDFIHTTHRSAVGRTSGNRL